jgi:hypothetical protein
VNAWLISSLDHCRLCTRRSAARTVSLNPGRLKIFVSQWLVLAMRYLAMRAARRTRILGTDSKDTLEQLALRRKSNAITLSRQVELFAA